MVQFINRRILNVSDAIRIAALHIHDSSISIGEDGHKDARCTLDGVVGRVFSILFDKLQTKGFGCTANEVEGIGTMDPSTGMYDGALGQVQRGEADFVGMPVYLPLNDTDGMFRYSNILHADTMTMFSAYFVNTTVHDGDIFSMFGNIPRGLWIGYVTCFFTFLLVSFIGSKLLEDVVVPIWTTTCAFLDQDNYPLSTSKFISIMSFIVMLGMFLMMTYACNCMSTDLVTIDKPYAITTYEQIISSYNVKVGLNMVLPEWEKFSSAEGFNERALFAKTFPVQMDPAKFVKTVPMIINKEMVFISRPFIAVGLALVSIALPSWPSIARAYVAPDPHATEYMNVFVHSKRLAGKPVEKYMNLVTARLGEHGFAEFVQSRSGPMIVSLAMRELHLPSHEQMVTSKVEEQSPDVSSIGWPHVRRVMIMVLILSIIAAVALVGEHVMDMLSKYKQYKLKKSRRRMKRKQMDLKFQEVTIQQHE